MMSLYSRFRPTIERKFEPEKVSRDLKVIFIDTHSMKMGNANFYTLENKRTNMVMALENWPYLGAVFAIGFFVFYAVRTPLHKKLYGEALKSIVLGQLLALPTLYYYRQVYLLEVDKQYDWLKQRIKDHPELALPDSDDVNKNFGMSLYTEFESDDEVEYFKKENIFRGGDTDSHEFWFKEFTKEL